MAADTRALPAAGPATARPGVVLRWVLRERRRSLLGWALAVGAVAGIYASFYDVMDASEMEALIASMPEGLVTALGYDGLGSAPGFLESTVYGLLGPILLLVFGIASAARDVAGLEEDGALELELSAAISRRQVLLERYLAVVVQLAVLVAAISAVVVAVVVGVGMDVAADGLLAGGIGLWLLAVAVSSVAFAAGAATGRRTVALAAGAALGVSGYLANALAGLVEDPGPLEAVSPFAWYLRAEPLVGGLDAAGTAALLGSTAVALAVAVVGFARRDLGA